MSSQDRYLATREPPWEQNELPWEHSLENNGGGRKDRYRKPDFVWREEGERQKQKA